VTINGANGSGNWTFTWTYTVAVGSDPSAARDCWTLQDSDTTNAELAFDVGIFAESVVKSNNLGRKASFTMTEINPITLLPVSRVTALHYSVTQGDTEIASGDLLPDTITSQCSNPDPSFYDWSYSGTSGENGVVSLLSEGTNTRPPASATIGAVLNGDAFANNDTSIADACKNVEKSTSSASGILLTSEGTYALTITGTVKGNGALQNTPFSVSSTICVSAGSCETCP
jgi:hypothetical protein